MLQTLPLIRFIFCVQKAFFTSIWLMPLGSGFLRKPKGYGFLKLILTPPPPPVILGLFNS